MIVTARPNIQRVDTTRDADIETAIEIGRLLREEIRPGIAESENGKRLVNIYWEVLEKAGRKMDYVGPYVPDKTNPLVTNPRPYERWAREEGCSDIPISRGVIGTSIRAGQSYLVRSIQELEASNPTAHWACNNDPDPRNRPKTELVLLLDSRVEKGEYAGISAPRAVLDLDFMDEDAISESFARTLEQTWLQYGPLLFPGPPGYDVGRYIPHIINPDTKSCQI